MSIVRPLLSLASAALLSSLSLIFVPVSTEAATNPLTLTATADMAQAGQSITYTLHDAKATASTEYQFWIENPSGHWSMAQGYGASDQFTLKRVMAGSYVVTGYALSHSAISVHEWSMAQSALPQSLFVNSSVGLSVKTMTNPFGQTVATVTATSSHIANPRYQLWWQTPSGTWMSSGGYHTNASFLVPVTEAGTYQFTAYAKPPMALSSNLGSAHSATTSLSLSVPVTAVSLTPAASGLHANSGGVDTVAINVWDTNQSPVGNFNGSVTITDSANALLTASGVLTNTVTVPISQGMGTVQVMASTTSGQDVLTASGLSAFPGSMTSAMVRYGSATIQFRAPGGNISTLNTIEPVASTNAQNGDMNPYGLTYDSYAGTTAAPNPFFGDLLVSNFSNAAGTFGAGSTIEAMNPMTGNVSQFSANATGPVALAVSPKGPLWVANFGNNGTPGNVAVLTPNGGEFPNGGSIITNSAFSGPWGQVFVPNATTPAFFVTNALNGTIDALYGFAPPAFNSDTQVSVIGSGLSHSGTGASTVKGPQGMVYDPSTHMVYVTDTADNSIRGYYWNGPNTPSQGTGQLIYQGGALKAPAGITLDPLNGDLLVVNQGNNHLVEINLNNGHAFVTGQKVLDNTAVNPMTSQGSALFGVYAMNNNGQLNVFFTNDNTNTVNVLK